MKCTAWQSITRIFNFILNKQPAANIKYCNFWYTIVSVCDKGHTESEPSLIMVRFDYLSPSLLKGSYFESSGASVLSASVYDRSRDATVIV